MPFSKASLGKTRSLILLAPSGACLKPFSGPIECSDRLHTNLTHEMQRLRGRIYLEDGAIKRSDLTSDDRHATDVDWQSWHLLTLASTGDVQGCTRFRHHDNAVRYNQLGVSGSPLAACPQWGNRFKASVNRELDRARKAGYSYLEIGGWALARELRCSTEALRSVLSIFALGTLRGGALGISTATERNSSASILRRLGGQPLEWAGTPLPAYYDARYRCGMEVLRFDSASPNPKYGESIRELRSMVSQIPVICPDRPTSWAKAAFQFAPSFSGFMPSPIPIPFGV